MVLADAGCCGFGGVGFAWAGLALVFVWLVCVWLTLWVYCAVGLVPVGLCVFGWMLLVCAFLGFWGCRVILISRGVGIIYGLPRGGDCFAS